MPRDICDVDVIGAVRLALEAGANDRAKVAVIERLIADAPETPSDNTGSVHLLIDAVKHSGAEFSLVDHSPPVLPAKSKEME